MRNEVVDLALRRVDRLFASLLVLFEHEQLGKFFGAQAADFALNGLPELSFTENEKSMNKSWINNNNNEKEK